MAPLHRPVRQADHAVLAAHAVLAVQAGRHGLGVEHITLPHSGRHQHHLPAAATRRPPPRTHTSRSAGRENSWAPLRRGRCVPCARSRLSGHGRRPRVRRAMRKPSAATSTGEPSFAPGGQLRAARTCARSALSEAWRGTCDLCEGGDGEWGQGARCAKARTEENDDSASGSRDVVPFDAAVGKLHHLRLPALDEPAVAAAPGHQRPAHAGRCVRESAAPPGLPSSLMAAAAPAPQAGKKCGA